MITLKSTIDNKQINTVILAFTSLLLYFKAAYISDTKMNQALLVLLGVVHIGHCLLSGDHGKTTSSIPNGHVSGGSGGTPVDSSILRDILTQETALRIQLQKNVDTLMKKFESMSNEMASLKQETSSLKQEVTDLRTENFKLQQSVNLLNASCDKGCQNPHFPVEGSGDALSSVSDLKTQVRYLTLSLLDLEGVTKSLKGKYNLHEFTSHLTKSGNIAFGKQS
jgi:hypothetical protein